MSHEIEANRFAYRESTERPWHVEEGGERDNRVPDADCSKFDRFMIAANMAVTYEKVAVTLSDTGHAVPGLYAIRRQDDGLVLPSVGVGTQYDILQPVECFKFFQPFLDSEQVILDTAMILRNGSRFVITAKVKVSEAEVAPGDVIRGYLVFYTSVDGSLVTGVSFVVTRVVCANTFRQMMGEKAPVLRVKHTKGQRATLAQIQEVLNVQAQKFEATTTQYRALQKSVINKSDLQKYVQIVLNFPTDEKGEMSTKGQNIVDRVIALADEGMGTDIPGVRGTAWGAYNALTEWTNHEAGRNEWSRQDSVLFGEYARTNDKALAVALEMFAKA